MAEVTKEQWHNAFFQVEASLTTDGYTCDDLVPPVSTSGFLRDGSTKRCIACETSLRLRAILLGDEA